jgi:hypothetical protein
MTPIWKSFVLICGALFLAACRIPSPPIPPSIPVPPGVHLSLGGASTAVEGVRVEGRPAEDRRGVTVQVYNESGSEIVLLLDEWTLAARGEISPVYAGTAIRPKIGKRPIEPVRLAPGELHLAWLGMASRHKLRRPFEEAETITLSFVFMMDDGRRTGVLKIEPRDHFADESIPDSSHSFNNLATPYQKPMPAATLRIQNLTISASLRDSNTCLDVSVRNSGQQEVILDLPQWTIQKGGKIYRILIDAVFSIQPIPDRPAKVPPLQGDKPGDWHDWIYAREEAPGPDGRVIAADLSAVEDTEVTLNMTIIIGNKYSAESLKIPIDRSRDWGNPILPNAKN